MKKYFTSYDDIVRQQDAEPVPPAQEEDQKSLLDLFKTDEKQIKASRRDFLKVFGFTATSAAIAASCENPVKKAIPLLNRPEEARPGKGLYYASSVITGDNYASVLVKVRDGRPIKIEGNELSSIFKGRTNARTQAAVLSLYDDGARYRNPMIDGLDATWEQADRKVQAALDGAGEKQVVLLSSSVYSPSAKRAIAAFAQKYPNFKHYRLDAISYSGMLQANQMAFGFPFIPAYRFDKADIIVSFGADFLGSWLSPVEFAGQWASRRDLIADGKGMSMHIQLEAGMSLTGSNADKRITLKPSQQKEALLALLKALEGNSSGDDLGMDALAGKLAGARGKSLVVCGSNDPDTQYIVNAINHKLGNYGSTIDTSTPIHLKQAIDTEIGPLIDDIDKGNVAVMMTWDVNPVYECLSGEFWKQALAKVDTTVSFANARTETSVLCDIVCPDNHILESWADAEPREGYYSLAQPTISPVYDTRQAMVSMLKWAGVESSAYDFLRQTWKDVILAAHPVTESFESFWGKTLQAGVFEPGPGESPAFSFNMDALAEASALKEAPEGEFEIDLYESVQMGSGAMANNPWLQELPDPLTKVTWDNFAAVSPADADARGWSDGDVIYINESVQLPVLVQPGQAEGTMSVALGYGRLQAGKVGNRVGANAFTLGSFGKTRLYSGVAKTVTALGYNKPFARSQEHESMEGRDIVRETTLAEYLASPDAGNELHEKYEAMHLTLYPDVEFEAHHWGMSVNMNACTGCSACVVACQAENNVAVVGKDEVRRRRIMHWIRIDRYYAGDSANPEVVYQPLMCQHCDNAPCENVCPVAATMHSNEGLNQMAYNRCVGTKYCINNCPYKVRRFNWFRYATNEEFDYNQNSDLGRMVLNPDVVVRERGVVEKCTFCVQRIQEAKLKAKLENRKLADGDVQTACMQACPSNAIVFGDLKDEESRVSKLFANQRNYHLLEQLHTLPSVGYLTKVRNTETAGEA